MRKTTWMLPALALIVACAHLQESDEVDPVVRGAWAGEGQFFDRQLDAEYRRFPVALVIHPDNTVSGTVGGATLVGGVVKARRDNVLVTARLTGRVFDAGSLRDQDKDWAVFILRPPHDSSTRGEIHLKTNPTFDFTMREAKVSLSKSS